MAKKNHLFKWSLFWSWRHFGHRKPAHIHWKPDKAPKTSHCLVRILVQRHNWPNLLRKWARRGRYSQWRSLSGHVERIFVHKNWSGGHVLHSRSYTRYYAPCFWRSHYPRSCDLTPLDYYLWGAVKISVMLASQRQLTLKGQYSWSHWWNTAAHNR